MSGPKLTFKNPEKRKHLIKGGVFVGVFSVIGLLFLFFASAESSTPSIQASQGVLSGNAVAVVNNGAYKGSAVRFQAPPPPALKYDLVVTDVGVSNHAVAGVKQHMWVDVKNVGNTAVDGGFSVGIFVDGAQQTWGWVGQQVNPDQTVRITGDGIMGGDPSQFWYATSGNHTLAATVDDTNAKSAESDESNNTLQKVANFAAQDTSGYSGVPTNLNLAWCGPPWNALQEEFNLAAMRGIGILGPPCQAGGGFVEQTIEQNNIAMDKAAAAGTRILVFGGYSCGDPYNDSCYKMLVDPNSVINQYPTRDGMAGYFVVDEPIFQDFDRIAAANQTVARRRPGLISYSNIYGNVVGSGTPQDRTYGLGCHPLKCPITFDDYVWNYIEKTRPQIMSYDDYADSQTVAQNSTNVIKHWQNSLFETNGIPVAPLMTAVPSVTNGFIEKSNALWLRYLDLKNLAQANGTILHFTWRLPPGSEWWGQGECGIAKSQTAYGYMGAAVCGY